MPKLNILNVSGENVGELELNENIFGIEINKSVLHESVKNYLANQRQGTQSAKTRAEVKARKGKPFRQKGTGRARQGSVTSPNMVGGGVAFAPKPRDYSYRLPKKVRRLAMKSALSSKVLDNEMIILDELSFDKPKTKDAIKVLNNINAEGKTLIVMDEKDENVVRSVNNIQKVKTTLVSTLNVYDILHYTNFVVTKSAAEKIEEVYK